MKHGLIALILSTLALFSVQASAVPFDITPEGLSFSPCGTCTTFEGRSIYIRANESFSIDGIDWYGDIFSGSYDVVIFEGLGETAALGSQLAIASDTLVGGVLDFNHIDIDFTFAAGNEYLVNFRRTDGEPFSTNFHYLSWGNGAEESNLGLLTLLDGRHGFAPDSNNNSWTTHFLFNVVDTALPTPVPVLSSWGLAILILAVLFVMYRQTSNWGQSKVPK